MIFAGLCLVAAQSIPHIALMAFAQQWRMWMRSEPMRYTLLGLGWLCLALVPFAGPIPGPGGIPLFALGAGLLLKNSRWAKRRYVAYKIRHPKHGSWADWALRRESAKRRAAIAQQNPPESD